MHIHVDSGRAERREDWVALRGSLRRMIRSKRGIKCDVVYTTEKTADRPPESSSHPPIAQPYPPSHPPSLTPLHSAPSTTYHPPPPI